jgi:hypothetical protein
VCIFLHPIPQTNQAQKEGFHMDKAFLEQMQKKVAQELRVKETETLTFWKDEIEKVVRKNTESLSALQVEIKNILTRMDNRLKAVKRGND